jgi:hypothetical protein
VPEDTLEVVIDCIEADWAVRRPVDSISKNPEPTFPVRISSATTESDVVLTEGTMTVFTNRFPVDSEVRLKKETSAMPPVATVVEMLLPYARGAVIKLVINVPVESKAVDTCSMRATGVRVIPVDTVVTEPVLMVAIGAYAVPLDKISVCKELILVEYVYRAPEDTNVTAARESEAIDAAVKYPAVILFTARVVI